jgi:hypothetical protein
MAKYLKAMVTAWEALPESERAAPIAGKSEVDPKRAALRRPHGCMVVRVFNRHLGWNEDRTLRYAVPADFVPKTSRVAAERYAEAQNDFMWIPEKEWRALIPAEPIDGNGHSIPDTFVLRLIRFHLDPSRGFSESAHFAATRSSAADLRLVVTEVSPERLTMQLTGTVKLEEPGRSEPSRYSPTIFGRLEIDRIKNAFTRFDIVALGTASGLPRDANGVVCYRQGPYPLGIAFELVANPTPAEQLHPRGARDNPAAYLEPKERR